MLLQESDSSPGEDKVEMKELVFAGDTMLDSLHMEKCIVTVTSGLAGSSVSPLVELAPLPPTSPQPSPASPTSPARGAGQGAGQGLKRKAESQQGREGGGKRSPTHCSPVHSPKKV